MAFREVSVIEVREVLRGWLAGAGLRTVAAQAGVDRKTARRYVQAAEAAGVVRTGGFGQVTDAVVGEGCPLDPDGMPNGNYCRFPGMDAMCEMVSDFHAFLDWLGHWGQNFASCCVTPFWY
jgi:hypothetical protein